MSYSSCSCLRPLVLALSLNLGPWTSTREWTLRGWVSQQCTVIPTFCCLPGNNIARMFHVSGWLLLIPLLQGSEFTATQWVFTTVSLANLLWLFLLGSRPARCLLCCLSDGEPQIWLGDLRLALCFLVCFLVVMICQAACDHRRPCSSFFTNSFFSCKDRALERDRPHQRKKKSSYARNY